MKRKTGLGHNSKALRLSKSAYMMGRQCPKALWLYKYRKDIKPVFSEQSAARMESGETLHQFAQKYFGEGLLIDHEPWEIREALASTSKYIEEGEKIIFEAAALREGKQNCYARIDVLRRASAKTWDLIEIKSSTQVREQHIEDLAFQYYVFSGAGYKIENCFLMYLNRDYLRKGELDLQALFHLEDLSLAVKNCQKEVEKTLEELGSKLHKARMPEVNISPHCYEPYTCRYYDHCWKGIPEYNLYSVYDNKGKEQEKLEQVIRKTKSLDVSGISPDLYPSGFKGADVECYQKNKIHVDREALREWLKELDYPLYFLDYETIMPAIPLYDSTRPYQQIVFQFSLHVQKKSGFSFSSPPEHYSFLHRYRSDPRKVFLRSLLKFCRRKGSIIVYNASFEKTRNEELALAFPKYAKRLRALNSRIVDLLLPFQRRYLYHPEQYSSCSLKAVLPLFSDLSYENMAIADGGTAMNAYQTFQKGLLSKEEELKLWHDLEEYCKQDSYAMVALLDTIRAYVKVGE